MWEFTRSFGKEKEKRRNVMPIKKGRGTRLFFTFSLLWTWTSCPRSYDWFRTGGWENWFVMTGKLFRRSCTGTLHNYNRPNINGNRQDKKKTQYRKKSYDQLLILDSWFLEVKDLCINNIAVSRKTHCGLARWFQPVFETPQGGNDQGKRRRGGWLRSEKPSKMNSATGKIYKLNTISRKNVYLWDSVQFCGSSRG